jgi:hypothetical protein
VICGLAAVVGQASIAPPSPHSASPLSFYVTAASCAKALSALPSPPPPSQYPTLKYGHNYKEIMYSVCTLIRQTQLISQCQVTGNYMIRHEKGLPVITFYFYQTDHFILQKRVFFHQSIV